jgi:hypothetical protein
MDDNCCDNPGNEQAKQAEQGGRCAIEYYAAPSLKALILLAKPLPQQTSYF